MPDAIADFLKYMSVDRGCSPATWRTYGADLRSFERFLVALDGAVDWRMVDKDHVRLWVASKMENGVKPQTVRRSLSSVRSFFRYLLMREELQRDPMQLVANPKAERSLPAFVPQDCMDVLLDMVVFPDSFVGRRDHLVLLTFYSAGLRISELVGLDVESISWERNELRVLGKRNKHRVVPCGPELMRALRNYTAEREVVTGSPLGALFVNVSGRRETDQNIRRMVKRYLSLVTPQEKRTPHVLRHSFATALLNNGANLEAVKDLLGHESVATTQIYTHTGFAELQRIYSGAHPRSAADGQNGLGEEQANW